MEFKPENPQNKKSDVKSNLSVKYAKEYLDRTQNGAYFESINSNYEIEYKTKLKPVINQLNKPNSILVVGIGKGIELKVLSDHFNNERTAIIGLDLSWESIQASKKFLNNTSGNLTLVHGSAINLPFKGSLECVIFSAILHEIYSYVENGKSAWTSAVKGATEALKVGGLLYVRDFAGVNFPDLVDVEIEDSRFASFYDDFQKKFRKFTFIEEVAANTNMAELVTNDYDFPKRENESFSLKLDELIELLLHYKNYVSDTNVGNMPTELEKWKEINERYLIPDPNSTEMTAMSPETYKQRILEAGNQALDGTGHKLICTHFELSKSVLPENMINLLRKSLKINSDKYKIEDIIDILSTKVSTVFKRIKKDENN